MTGLRFSKGHHGGGEEGGSRDGNGETSQEILEPKPFKWNIASIYEAIDKVLTYKFCCAQIFHVVLVIHRRKAMLLGRSTELL